jgi:glucose-1-phosphate thymidylyltransferase
MYDSSVFDIISSLRPSSRGELEISEVNDIYAKKGFLEYEIFKGWWGDAGVSVDKLLEVNNYVAKKKKENPNNWSFRHVREESG